MDEVITVDWGLMWPILERKDPRLACPVCGPPETLSQLHSFWCPVDPSRAAIAKHGGSLRAYRKWWVDNNYKKV